MTDSMVIRKLTDAGVEQFRNYLDLLRQGSTNPPPYHLLEDSKTSVLVEKETHIKNRLFNTRMEVAEYLDSILDRIGTDSIETDIHLWSWLSLFYFDQVCPVQKDGTRKPGRDYRHILEPGYPYGHRHLICGAHLVYTVYGLGGKLCRLLLSTIIPVESKFHHELATRQGFITNHGILEAAHILYFDESTDRPKRGAQVKKKAPGTFYRFIDIIHQLDLNYDLYSMSGKEVLELLPAEFDKWKGQ